MNNNWHSLSGEEVVKILNIKKAGLSAEEVQARQTQFGKNTLPKGKEPTLIEIFLRQFKSPIILILAIAGLASSFIGEFIDMAFIAAVVLINAILGTYQEYNAVKSSLSIQNILKIKSKVSREGKTIEIDSEDLVPGDVVLLESGDKVPADIRLIEIHNLQIDEAFLTGESEAVRKNTDTLEINVPVADRKNMCYASSSIQSGRGVGIVIATGINTEIGNIAESVSRAKDTKSPLTIRMEKFTKSITFFILIAASITAILMITKGYENREIFLLTVAMCISAIPEGIPMAMTIALSIAANKMIKKNVIVKKLSSVESLGSCTVIASDKTGTLTVNEQTAKILVLPDESYYKITGEGYNDKGNIKLENVTELQNSQVEYICQVGMINNEAFLEKKDGIFVHHGDSIDLAFLSMGMKYGINKEDVEKELRVFGQIPYESENKFSAVFFEKDNVDYVTVKGSAETILELCTSQTSSEGKVPLEYEKLEKEYLHWSKEGYRVIAVAAGEYNSDRKDIYDKEDISNLTFLGFVGFIDPIRSTSKNAINKCIKAGIRVVMITGDHPLTAKAIAKELELINEEGRVITGNEVEEAFNYSKHTLTSLLKENNVFARVSPHQKAIIVEALKEQGEFIATTGDGINDAPALKAANIGVAMGSGTDVAKDVSTMIITDDNFNSIVSAVEEGRFAYNNVRKVIYLLLSTALAEVLLFILAIIFNLPPPFLAVQILWLNLVTNGIQDVALAFEKGEAGVMKEKPRSTKESIFDRLLIGETVVSGLFIFLMVFVLWYILIKNMNMPIPEARNYILLLMVLLQNVHAFNCRSEKNSVFKTPLKNNYLIVFGILISFTVHVIFMNVPILQNILKVNPVSLKDFAIIFIMALPILAVMETFKSIYKELDKKQDIRNIEVKKNN